MIQGRDTDFYKFYNFRTQHWIQCLPIKSDYKPKVLAMHLAQGLNVRHTHTHITFITFTQELGCQGYMMGCHHACFPSPHHQEEQDGCTYFSCLSLFVAISRNCNSTTILIISYDGRTSVQWSNLTY